MSLLKSIQERRALRESVEQLDEGMRKIATLHSDDGKHHATVHKDTEYGEYRVKHHTNGVHHPNADYHTDDKDDAIGTAQHNLKHMQNTHKEGFEYDGEMLSELSKTTLGRYTKKAAGSIDKNSYKVGHHDGKLDAGHSNPGHKPTPEADASDRKVKNRINGIRNAVHRLTKEDIDELVEAFIDTITEEEIEQLDELSKGTLNSYLKKNAEDHKDRIVNKPHDSDQSRKKLNRAIGARRAINSVNK